MKQRKRMATKKLSQNKRYQPPKLVNYGDLRRLTRVKGGNSGDGGGKPQTKTSGMQA